MVECRNGHTVIERTADGRCIECKHEKDKRYFDRNEERKVKRYKRTQEWKLDHPDEFKLYQRKSLLKRKYQISLDEYNSLLREQNNLCKICLQPETTRDRSGKVRESLCIDHDHSTKKVRGLLCHHCNAALGHAQENPELLRRMAEYLETFYGA